MATDATTFTTETTQVESSQIVQIVVAALLGFIIVLGVGFLPMDEVHNAAHDNRHSHGFPCH